MKNFFKKLLKTLNHTIYYSILICIKFLVNFGFESKSKIKTKQFFKILLQNLAEFLISFFGKDIEFIIKNDIKNLYKKEEKGEKNNYHVLKAIKNTLLNLKKIYKFLIVFLFLNLILSFLFVIKNQMLNGKKLLVNMEIFFQYFELNSTFVKIIIILIFFIVLVQISFNAVETSFKYIIFFQNSFKDFFSLLILQIEIIMNLPLNLMSFSTTKIETEFFREIFIDFVKECVEKDKEKKKKNKKKKNKKKKNKKN